MSETAEKEPMVRLLRQVVYLELLRLLGWLPRQVRLPVAVAATLVCPVPGERRRAGLRQLITR